MTDSDQTQPIAVCYGRDILELPKDLYIPPDALEVFLEAFAGPLDFLLYLIKRQNMDILDIPIAKITAQYIEYIRLMEGLRFELAAEYLVMAATLAEIKSRMLLPRSVSMEEEDPRADLVRRLQEYERFKYAAAYLDTIPRMERDTARASVSLPDLNQVLPRPVLELRELWFAFQEVLRRASHYQHHQIHREPISVRERMSHVLDRLKTEVFTEFHALFPQEEGRAGVVVTFLALLELLKGELIEIVQSEAFMPIHIRLKTLSI
jgi:segregation and condensation protein A